MASRTVDFLPPIFQTVTNRQFLGATLDQLVQEPQFKRTQGFVGRRVGPGVNPNDSYVVEPDATRANYQLEPGVVFLKPDTTEISDAITYPGITDAIRQQGGITSRADRLYTSDYYTWDPFINFDKFVNYSQYYWLPAGPDSVNVSATVIPLTNDITVTRTSQGYQFSGVTGNNPTITLVRSGNYNFDVNQLPNGFWIQVEPGVNGVLSYATNISSRDVYGVINNGDDVGTITFNVPEKNAQQFYYNLTNLGSVDLITNLKFNQINNQYLSTVITEYGGIDGITSLDGLTIVFTNEDDDGWVNESGITSGFDEEVFGESTPITDPAERYSVWRIQYAYDDEDNIYLTLTSVEPVPELNKFKILFGTEYAETQWFKNSQGYFEQIPLLTAVNDVVWYQDATNPDIFGRIVLIDQASVETLDVDTDILGKINYTSPNGVVFTNGLKVQFRGDVTPSSYANNEYYVAGVGTAIQLLPVSNYVTPETYTQSAATPYDVLGYDDGNFDATLNQPLEPDYLTISLDSPDLNAWSRSNRWFHVDVITASATYNNVIPVLDNAFRAKRPILEFRGGTKLFNMGTQAKQPIDIIDFEETDALSNINGSIGYSVDGYNFITGTRVIFAADVDAQVRNKVYEVEFITPSTDGSTLDVQPIINLVPAADSTVLVNQCVVCLSGSTLQGKSFYYDGTEWDVAQEKTSINQAPLFDVFDSNGYSLGDSAIYSSSTFAGSKLFSYALGTGAADPVLGSALKYLTLENVGDIVFDNNFYTDTFIYIDNNASITESISTGFVRQYLDRITFETEIGWQQAATQSKIYQQFSFTYTAGMTLTLDVAVVPEEIIPSVKIYVGSEFLDSSFYTVSTTANTTVITLSESVSVDEGEIIEVLGLSNQVSKVGFYQVPINLENNPLNENSSGLTLGTIRTHYQSICENLINLTGDVDGANNTRDLGNIIPYGLNILQQSSPMTLAGYFLRNPNYNIFNSIAYSSREYEKFKAQFLNTAVTNDYTNNTVAEILTLVIDDINVGKTSSDPFYWSDMMPAGSVYTQIQTTVTFITTNIFDTTQVYNYTSANYLGLLVYVNDTLLTRGIDYTVATDGPRITINTTLTVGDVVTIQEYSNTAGSFIPNTPTKLGLYPAFVPEIFLDESYITPTMVIRGHDGSITKAFGDFRDDLLLEFERRIYNNLKLDGNPVPLTADVVIPGQFRTTDYSLNEITDILSQDFLTWVAWNKLDYKAQDYQAGNAFTYNYSTAANKLDPTTPLPVGAWRGIYNYFYDTIYPNTKPWEMLGFSIEPEWWEDEYGPAPYTSGNLVLWEDLAAGIVRDPDGEYILPLRVRPGLTNVIPAGPEGELVAPLQSVVGNYNSNDFRKSWVVGDDGPVENAWRTSSAYPFAIMRLLALTRPAEFFSLFADRDLYKFDETIEQYLYNQRYRLDANGIEVYGNGVSKASYIDWIVDYNRQSGIDSTETLTLDLQNLEVRLCYRMAAFTGKNLLQVYTERSSPASQNSSLMLPDESYNLLFYKNVPFDRLTYSSVIVQSTENGWAVYGYSTMQPYFNILQSRVNGNLTTISAGGTSVRVPVEYSNTVVQIPYGYVFTNQTLVADFLLSYGKLLENQGLVFDTLENGYVLDWNQMVSEFLYWSNQGWEPGSVINLNPGASEFRVERPNAIVDSLAVQTPENQILNADRTPFNARDLVIERLDNTFAVRSLSGETINYLNLNFTTFENMIVLDNESIFADLIYDPVTGARQSRVQLSGFTSTDWNGQLNAPGFILNQDNIKEWQPTRKYARGEIVLYKTRYYSAVDIVQPKAKFDFNEWTISDYTKIQQGLLPNLPNKSDQLANAYSVYNANLEEDQDLFSYGLIGFRPRQYMAALNLDDVSQVNLYKQFLGTKGTVTSAELFTFADLGRGSAEYNIYENWALLRGTYGANANRSYYEVRLNEALLTANPSSIQIVNNLNDQSEADQKILLGSIWKSSYKLTSPEILTTTLVTPTDISLPSAGYVNIDDVDITVFDINDPAALNENLDEIGVGTTVWAAKVNNYDWNIYRTTKVPGYISTVTSNLDGTSIVRFTQTHGLSINDTIVIRFFSSDVNGVYKVIDVPAINEITIEFQFLSDQIVATGEGVAFVLESQRVAQSSDVINLPYANSLIPGNKVWVDDNGSGLWEVLEKQDVFTSTTELTAATPIAQSNYGQTVGQSLDNLYALVGSPDFNSGTGAIYTYIRTELNPLAQNSIVDLNSVPDTVGFGSSLSVGGQNWQVAGAPESYNNRGYVAVINRTEGSADFIVSALLTVPNPTYLAQEAEFGYSVAVSEDERWMYIGSPGINKVFAYGLVEVENQSVRYLTDGTKFTFNFSDSIVIDEGIDEQVTVVLNNELLTPGVDYTQTNTDVVFSAAPPKDLVLIITRRTGITFDGDGSTQTFSLNEYLYTATNIYSFKVLIDGVLQRPNIDYEFNADDSSLGGRDIIFATAPTNGTVISVVSQSYYTFVDEIEFSTIFTGSISGTVLTVSDVSDSIAPLNVGMEIIGAGVPQGTYIVSLSTGTGGIGTYIISNSASVASSTLTAKLPADARFGQSISCTVDGQQLMIGAPYDRVDNVVDAGSVYVYNRAVQQFIVTDSSETEYTTNGTIVAPVSVTLNGTFLTNEENNVSGDFSVTGNTVTLNVDTAVGDTLDISVNQFDLVQIITQNVPYQTAKFGWAVDICRNSCSLYVGAPTDGTVLPSAGSVQRSVNQSRIYGTITSLIENARLTAGNTIQINNIEVELSSPDTWTSSTAWVTGDLVEYDLGIYVAVRNVPTGTDITDRTYWQISSWAAVLAEDINNSVVPNVTASAGIVGTENFGKLTLAVTNYVSSIAGNRLSVAPGLIGHMYYDLGFETFVFTQTIESPAPSEYAEFGAAVNIDTRATTLTIGAPKANLYRPNTFDNNTTYFDSRTTIFNGPLIQSGAVYTFDYLASASESVTNPGKFAFGQQVYDSSVQELDQYGIAVDYTNGILLVGVPGSDVDDSAISAVNYGRVSVFSNPNLTPAWAPIHLQQPVVDIKLINSVFSYDLNTGAQTSFFDFFDPLQGKILGAARQNIDYGGAVDPAAYNVGAVNNYGKIWAQKYVGKIWWDTNSVRFINPNQDDIVYAARRWGQLFPGSSVDIYQWVSSSVPPANYTGPGVPKNTTSYSVTTAVNDDGIFVTTYYFWVRGITTINTAVGKTLSPVGIAQYISDPRSSGIPYVAFVSASATAIYNSTGLISAQDTILSIEYDRELNEDNVHTEYSLIPENRGDGFLPDIIYRKFQDSFCGADSLGNLVPDPTLSVANRYGVQFRPRQSMFTDRYAALENYLVRVNSVLLRFPIVESRSFDLLNSEEPEPTATSGEWNDRVANIEELSYQNFANVPVGYRYLVTSDSTQNGFWTIYSVTEAKTFATLVLYRVQNYDTTRYWQTVNWYQPGYNSSTQIVAEVPVYSQLETLSIDAVPVGSSVRVTANSVGKFEIYLRSAEDIWTRVGLEDGTIEFKEELWNYELGRFGFGVEVFDAQYFDQAPIIETRKIIQSINEELLIGDLLIERNKALILMFNFILSEFEAPEWLTKTSLIDVDHRIRSLEPYQIYQQDNQDFVVNYIQEVKPYHVQIRELNLIYDGLDTYQGSMTDFDVPSFYNTTQIPNQFMSPVLTPYTVSSAIGTGTPTLYSDTAPDSSVWQTQPWNFWYENYTLTVDSAIVVDGGIGYSVAPQVTVTGDCLEPAEMIAVVNSAGVITDITVLNPGSGYTTTAIIELSGGNGTGGRAIAVMSNGLVRNIKTTIKYDRYQYQSTVVDWEADVVYENGTLVRYDNRVWEADSPDSSTVESTTFDPDQWILVDAATLSGVDRTMGLYQPTANQPGLDLPLLIDGIDYPGVQVDAPDFNENAGYDVGNFDINPFDNISYGPEGRPTYDPSILDAVYESQFTDVYLGIRPSDVIVDGGAFVDTYSSHAPEELVPGSEFDTLDFRVYTRPGSDWDENGHGFAWEIVKWIWSSTETTFSFAGLVPNPVQVIITNQTQQNNIPLADVVIDWVNLTVTVPYLLINPPASEGDVIVISAYGIGGGNQLYKNTFNGGDVGNTVTIPVTYNEIEEFAIFVNGQLITDYSFSAQGLNTVIVFGTTYGANDAINITALGTTDGSLANSWSTPVTQYFVSAGQLDYSLDNFMGGTNPANMVVEKNGIRARPPEGAYYIVDGSSAFALPNRGGYSQALIADNEVRVWLNNEELTLGSDFTVEPYTSTDDVREVILSSTPMDGSTVLVTVWTKADYTVQSDGSSLYTNQLLWKDSSGFKPVSGDIISVTTWNDTSQQEMVTLVFQGPVTTGITVNEPYDSTDYDSGSTSGDPGSFDYTEGVVISINDLQLGRTVPDPTRTWVTLNGARLCYGNDFTISGEELILYSGTISVTDVVAIELFTDSVVPEALEFRIFQDMRGVQATYRMTPNTTTTLTQTLYATDDVAYVDDVSALTQPNLAVNIWGVLTVNGERIMYRAVNYDTNSVSGLRRGTAGTGAAEHTAGSTVYNLGRGNLVPAEYQDTIVFKNYTADGSTVTFIADNIDLSNLATEFAEAAILVYVGGTRVTTEYTVDSIGPVTITFDTAPTEGYEVSIQVRQGLSWYEPGNGTASNGVALQLTDTLAAEFFRGL